MRRLGVDLGGTKIEVVVLDGSGAERCRRRVPTPRGDYAATLAAIAGLVGEAERSAGPCGSIGVGIPGSISPHTGLVRNANSTWLNGRPLAGDLARALGRDVRVANDANCFALSEATDGAAAGLAVVFGVILGTGVGGGIVVDGRVLEGANGIAGEWGHNPLPAPFLDGELPGPRCWCGRQGCVEAWLSGPALAASAALPGAGAASDAADRAAADAARAISAMRAGEPRAVDAFERYCDRLARSLAGVINLLDPDAIVLGGGLSNVDELYVEVPRRWSSLLFADRAHTPLLRNRHGDSSGVRGAARLAD
jgi:fructokinase